MRAYVGVDWSTTEVVCAVAAEDGNPTTIRGGAKPSLSSVRELVERVRGSTGAEEICVLIEAGALIWLHLFHAAGAVVHVADSKQARRFAESQGSSGAKDDPRDAASLAAMCRSPSHRKDPWTPDTIQMQQVDVLVGLHEQLTKDLGRVRQRLREMLRMHMPLVEAALPRDLLKAWVSVFLRKVPTPWHAQKLDRKTFDALTSSAKPATRERLWTALQQTEAPWLDSQVAKILGRDVQIRLEQLAQLGKQLAYVDKQIDAVTDHIEGHSRMTSMKGIGTKLATSLLVNAFRDGVPAHRDQVSIRMGSSPVFSGSARTKDGKRKGKVRMRKAVSSRARRDVFLIGRLASQNLAWARAQYAHAMAHGHEPATAYRRIARSVLRIQSAMARTGQDYDDAKYVASLKAKRVPWAASL